MPALSACTCMQHTHSLSSLSLLSLFLSLPLSLSISLSISPSLSLYLSISISLSLYLSHSFSVWWTGCAHPLYRSPFSYLVLIYFCFEVFILQKNLLQQNITIQWTRLIIFYKQVIIKSLYRTSIFLLIIVILISSIFC
jgi:hypothetical protein